MKGLIRLILITVVIFFVGLLPGQAREFLGAGVVPGSGWEERLKLTYGGYADKISAGIYLLEFVGLGEKAGGVWVSLYPQAKPFTIVSPELAGTLVGKRLLEYDLKLKRDASSWLEGRGIEGEEDLFRCWIELKRALVEKAEGRDFWVVNGIKLSVSVELEGGSDRPRWADDLERWLEKRVNSSRDYAGLRDVVRAWVLSRLVGGEVDVDLSAVAWSKAKVLGEYKELFNSEAAVGGIFLTDEYEVEQKELKEGVDSYNWQDVEDYFRLGVYGVRISEDALRDSLAKTAEVKVYLGTDEVGSYKAKLVQEFKGLSKEYLQGIIQEFFGEATARELADFILDRLSGLEKIRVFSFPPDGHDVYGMSFLGRNNAVGVVLMSSDCFDGSSLNQRGKYVFVHELVHLALSKNGLDVIIRYGGRHRIAFEVILEGVRERKVLLTSDEIENVLFPNERDKREMWLKSFYRGTFLGDPVLHSSFKYQKEKSVDRLIGAIAARNKEHPGLLVRWMSMGHRLIFERLRKLDGPTRKFNELHEFLFKKGCPSHLRIEILRELHAKDATDEEIEAFLEYIDLVYDALGPHMIFPALTDEKHVKWAHKKFWLAIVRSAILYRGLYLRHREVYKKTLKYLQEWLKRYKSEGVNWAFSHREIRAFYRRIAIILASPSDMYVWSILNTPQDMLLVPPEKIVFQFLRFSTRLLAGRVFTSSTESFKDYSPDTSEITLNLDGKLSLSLATQHVDEFDKEKLLKLVDEMVVMPELKSRLKEVISRKFHAVELRIYDFLPENESMYLDKRRKIIFLPRAFVEFKELVDVKNGLILFGILEFALEEGMSVENIVDLRSLDQDERLLGRYAYKLYRATKNTKALAWFFLMLNMREKFGEELRDRFIANEVFLKGRLNLLGWAEKNEWLQWQKRKDLVSGKESFWVRRLLPDLAKTHTINKRQYNKVLGDANAMLLDIAAKRDSIYELLKGKDWFESVYLPMLEEYRLYLDKECPPPLRQRIVAAFTIVLADALSLENLGEGGDEVKRDLERMSLVLARRVKRVSWDLIYLLRNRIINKMAEEKRAVGGIAL